MGIMDRFSETWPKAGMMLNDVCYRQRKWEHRIGEIAFGSLPTPKKRDGKGFYTASLEQALNRDGRVDHWIHVALRCHRLKKGWANPRFSELMMGWPIGWTDLQPLETVKFRRWLRQFGNY
jgi:hypothetical protein